MTYSQPAPDTTVNSEEAQAHSGRARLIFAMKLAISVALLAWLIGRSDTPRLWGYVRSASIAWLGTAVLMYFFMVVASAWRWGLLLAAQGGKGTVRVTQFGGSYERDVIVLPELALRIGGLETWLKPANVFSRPVGDDRWHGNLGMDVLTQAKTVTIDFRSMSIGLK